MTGEEALALVWEIGERFKDILTDDNRATADPIFLVQQKKKSPPIDPAYDDAKYVWVNMESGDYEEAGKAETALLDQMDAQPWAGDPPKGWEKIYYVDIWETVQPFFTEADADDYILRMAHRLNETRVYVESAYRNHELIYLRKVLAKMAQEAKND